MLAALDGGAQDTSRSGGSVTGMGAAAAARALVRAGCRNVFVTRGARGVLWARDAGGGEVVIEELPALALGPQLVHNPSPNPSASPSPSPNPNLNPNPSPNLNPKPDQVSNS